MRTSLSVVQNLGLYDRCLRVLAGVILLGGSVAHLVLADSMVSWHAYTSLLSIYPFLTGILGWDPLYEMAEVRSCQLTGRNQCGTFPYELESVLGGTPQPEEEYDHSLAGVHR